MRIELALGTLASLESFGPTTSSTGAATDRSAFAEATLISATRVASMSRRACLPRLCGVLAFSRRLDASFRDLPPRLVSCGYRPWASSFEGFSPPVAPEASRLAVSSVSLPRLRVAGFEDFGIGRMRFAASHD